ncbi:MAG: hypothetical protein AAGF12_29045 [Myxococcota bacterium]
MRVRFLLPWLACALFDACATVPPPATASPDIEEQTYRAVLTDVFDGYVEAAESDTQLGFSSREEGRLALMPYLQPNFEVRMVAALERWSVSPRQMARFAAAHPETARRVNAENAERVQAAQRVVRQALARLPAEASAPLAHAH